MVHKHFDFKNEKEWFLICCISFPIKVSRLFWPAKIRMQHREVHCLLSVSDVFMRMCSFRPSCQFLTILCPSVFDRSSTHWTPRHPVPARWAADRPAVAEAKMSYFNNSLMSQRTICDLKLHSCCVGMWGQLTSAQLPARCFSLCSEMCFFICALISNDTLHSIAGDRVNTPAVWRWGDSYSRPATYCYSALATLRN